MRIKLGLWAFQFWKIKRGQWTFLNQKLIIIWSHLLSIRSDLQQSAQKWDNLEIILFFIRKNNNTFSVLIQISSYLVGNQRQQKTKVWLRNMDLQSYRLWLVLHVGNILNFWFIILLVINGYFLQVTTWNAIWCFKRT